MFTKIHRTASDFKSAIAVSRITFHFALVEIGTNFKTDFVHTSIASRPLPKTPTGKLHPERLHNRNTIQSASTQNPLANPVNKSCTGVQWIPSGILSVGLQSPMVDSGFASRCTSYRAMCPRSWTSKASNLEQALAPMHVQASQNCPHRHDMHARFDASYSESRATPTSNGIRYSLQRPPQDVSPSGSSPLCHEIHLQDLPKLARVSALNCHEQFSLELELVSVTEDSSDQRQTASWITHDLLHQTFLVAVSL